MSPLRNLIVTSDPWPRLESPRNQFSTFLAPHLIFRYAVLSHYLYILPGGIPCQRFWFVHMSGKSKYPRSVNHVPVASGRNSFEQFFARGFRIVLSEQSILFFCPMGLFY